MNDHNENQLKESMNADPMGTRQGSRPDAQRSSKGKGKGAKLSPGLKIALGIVLTIMFLWGYYTAACVVAVLRVGFI